MPSNCGGNKTAAKQFVYTDGNGRQWTYNTEIEAMAAKVRDSNRGNIRTVTK
jgi:hypothetical protein